jgi:molybdopterin-containing oxidoreductase family iron-sulfur binding subunit
MVACPYHARSFNWWDPEWPGTMTETLNPAVSTRTRGVVEKCNFCVQRLQAARTRDAAAGGDPAVPSRYTPACVESCPAGAIVFGDLADPQSEVSRLARSPEAFRLLERLGTGAKVYYRTRRPWVHEAVADAPPAGEGRTHA